MTVEWSDESSACVVLASRGYPGKYETGIPIAGLDRLRPQDNVEVFHAGTSKSETGEFLTAGGRVLGVAATGGTLGGALAQCYGAIEKISWDGMQYRRDIGRFKEASTRASS